MNKDSLQENWFDLIKETNPTYKGETTAEVEQLARTRLASLLREYADMVEDANDPHVFGYFEERRRDMGDGYKSPFYDLRVTLSIPWGG